MQYCHYCQVHIRGAQKSCPLCGNSLPEVDPPEPDLFPTIPPTYNGHQAVRVLLFLSVACMVVSVAIYSAFPTRLNWPLFLLFAIVSMWLSLVGLIKKRHNIPKTILRQVAIVCLLSMLWDLATGRHGWSLDYVVPLVCMLAMVVMYVIAKILNLSASDYIVYFMLDGLFGIIPLLFLVFGWVSVTYPSILCVSVCILFLSAILIFQGSNIKQEWDKKMHL